MGSLLTAAIIISFLLSAFGTYFAYSWARKKRLFMPKVRGRDIHKSPVPRVGGLVMVAVFTVVILILNSIDHTLFSSLKFPFAIFGASIDKRLLGVLLGGVVLAVVMAFDDYKGLKPWQKLLGQVAVWAIVIATGIGLTYLNNPFGLEYNLTIFSTPVTIGAALYHIVWVADIILLFWLVGMMNAVNFIDGADGLAAGIGVIGFSVIGVLSLMPHLEQPAVATLSFIAAAVTLGCLLFNFYPAKVFLGDVGAMWIGYMLAVLSVISGGKLATLFLVLAVVILDALVVAIFRLIKGKNPLTTADQSHIHHRFMKAGLSMPAAVIAIWLLSATFGVLALLTEGQSKWLFVGILSIATLVFLLLIRRKKDGGREVTL